MLTERQERQVDQQQKVAQKSKRILRFRLVILIITVSLLVANLSFFAYDLVSSKKGLLPNTWVRDLPLLLALLSIVLAIIAWRLPFSSRRSVVKDTFTTPVSQPLARYSSLEPLVLPEPIFLFNQPLTKAHEFFGRTFERAKLIERSHQGASTSIVGPSRIGKTWLMSYLRLVASKELGPTFRVGYLDATSPSCKSVADFTRNALEELGCSNHIASHGSLGLATLEKAIKDLKSRKKTPILCIDEFEGLKIEKEFKLEFFSDLRAITSSGLVLIVASKKPLIDIVSGNLKTSPFFNIFAILSLKPFSLEEAEEFVSVKSSQAGFTKLEHDKLLKYGQQGEQEWFPLRLQMTGQLLQEDIMRATYKNPNYYRPNDPNYWQDFEKRLEVEYRRVVLQNENT